MTLVLFDILVLPIFVLIVFLPGPPGAGGLQADGSVGEGTRVAQSETAGGT